MALLVFSHANSFGASTYRVLFKQLRARGFKVRAVDQFGTRDDSNGERVLVFDRDVETTIYNTLPDNLDRVLRRHPLRCPVAFIGGLHSREMQQVGMAMTQRLTRGRITMLDGSHLFPMEKPVATAAAIEAAWLNMQALGTQPPAAT